ncbi:hypothetical protein ADIARSV_2789 [Arcticibacter svalbardensis MN12-7]|uniref:Uncharacterized protein n=1 Tax=Arcticibacter svalbardensis MN12-7 TaxID=1150600 RepID=R9GQX3_9SPHI|nr:hypothetical protein ADIARSV_2789 [Arcticibacter svalbardensis MN12-7]
MAQYALTLNGFSKCLLKNISAMTSSHISGIFIFFSDNSNKQSAE